MTAAPRGLSTHKSLHPWILRRHRPSRYLSVCIRHQNCPQKLKIQNREMRKSWRDIKQDRHLWRSRKRLGLVISGYIRLFTKSEFFMMSRLFGSQHDFHSQVRVFVLFTDSFLVIIPGYRTPDVGSRWLGISAWTSVRNRVIWFTALIRLVDPCVYSRQP